MLFALSLCCVPKSQYLPEGGFYSFGTPIFTPGVPVFVVALHSWLVLVARGLTFLGLRGL